MLDPKPLPHRVAGSLTLDLANTFSFRGTARGRSSGDGRRSAALGAGGRPGGRRLVARGKRGADCPHDHSPSPWGRGRSRRRQSRRKRRKLSELQGGDPVILVLGRGASAKRIGARPKDWCNLTASWHLARGSDLCPSTFWRDPDGRLWPEPGTLRLIPGLSDADALVLDL